MTTWEDALVLVISTIGFLSLLKPILKFVKWVYCMFLRPPKDLPTTYGSWSLVTGCTDGIGKALAFELASKGLNLVLVSRNPQKLKSTAYEIWGILGKTNKTHIKIIAVDFEKVGGEEIERQIKSEIEGLDVGVLINNAGSTAKGPRFFHENGMDDIDSILKVNIEGVCWVTRAVLPGMLKRKKGVIVNIGSGTSVVPSFPFSAVYAGTKAYVAMFSRSLGVEYQKHGIDIQCQIPLLVATKMASIRKSSFFVPSPKQYSKASIRWIGYEPLCFPYWTHALQWCIMDALPESLVERLIFRYLCDVRKKILEKESRNAYLQQKN